MTDDDTELVKEAMEYLERSYIPFQHHVAAAIKGDKKVYKALHLDTDGFDVCAEPIALSIALYNKDNGLDTIVAVTIDNAGDTTVIPPCGNCRQILSQYLPQIDVILKNKKTNEYFKIQAKDLLPYPYISNNKIEQ